MPESTALRESRSENHASKDAPIYLSSQDMDRISAQLSAGRQQDATNHGEKVLPTLQITDNDTFSKCSTPRMQDSRANCDEAFGRLRVNENRANMPRTFETPSEIGNKVDNAISHDSASEMRRVLEDVAAQGQRRLDVSHSPAALRNFEDQLNDNIKAHQKGVVMEVDDGKVTAHLVEVLEGRQARAAISSDRLPPGFFKVNGVGVVHDLIAPATAKEQTYRRGM